MKKSIQLFAFLFTVLVCVSSCSKIEELATVVENHKLERQWVVSDVLSVDGSRSVSIMNDFLEDCDKDDVHDFRTGGILQIQSGTTKCDPAEANIVSGTWTLLDNNRKLKITQLMGSMTFNVDELSTTSMRMSIGVTDFLASVGIPASTFPHKGTLVYVYRPK
jgi:hypothetical protein